MSGKLEALYQSVNHDRNKRNWVPRWATTVTVISKALFIWLRHSAPKINLTVDNGGSHVRLGRRQYYHPQRQFVAGFFRTNFYFLWARCFHFRVAESAADFHCGEWNPGRFTHWDPWEHPLFISAAVKKLLKKLFFLIWKKNVWHLWRSTLGKLNQRERPSSIVQRKNRDFSKLSCNFLRFSEDKIARIIEIRAIILDLVSIFSL